MAHMASHSGGVHRPHDPGARSEVGATRCPAGRLSPIATLSPPHHHRTNTAPSPHHSAPSDSPAREALAQADVERQVGGVKVLSQGEVLAFLVTDGEACG